MDDAVASTISRLLEELKALERSVQEADLASERAQRYAASVRQDYEARKAEVREVLSRLQASTAAISSALERSVP